MNFWLCILGTMQRLNRIPIPSHVYLIDTGNEGHAGDSRPPPPHPPGDLFLTDKPDESRYLVSATCCAGGRAGRGWGAGRGGRRERRKRASYPVNRAYTHKILQFSYFLLGNEPIRGSHFSSFLHILPLKQYNG